MDIDLSGIPLTPGVYLFKSGRDKIIYVGKAKCLRRRVASYFRTNQAALSPKTQALLRQAVALDILSTTTEKEALLLEAELIKKHRPRYNITLRDDKQYFLFCLDKNHPFPRLAVIRPRPGRADNSASARNDEPEPDFDPAAALPSSRSGRAARRRNVALFGPYASGLAARETWRLLHHIFPLRRCSDRMFRNRVRPCLYYQMGQCLGPCTLPVDQAEYARMVEQVELFLSGRSRELLDLLRSRMLKASEALNFEQAAVLRDQIHDVEKTVEQQVVVSQTTGDLDVLGLAEAEEGLGLGIIFVRGGKVMDGRVFFWPGLTLAEGSEAINGFLGQFYSRPSLVPARILLPWKLAAPEDPSTDDPLTPQEPAQTAQGNPTASAFPTAAPLEQSDAVDEQTELWEDVLSDLRGAPVRLLLPHDSRTRRLVRMAEANARQGAKTVDQAPLAELLAARLHLAAPPSRIEAVDISHTGGQEARAGLVVFVDGAPRRDEFRAYTLEKHPPTHPPHIPIGVQERVRSGGGEPQGDHPLGGLPLQGPLPPEDSAFTPGDDYGALAAWVRRRLDSGPPWPDLLLIDGGLGQLAVVERALHEAGQDDIFALAAIAKARTETGRPDRRAGNVADRIFIPGRKNPLPLSEGSPELLFLQRVRDAVHDHALGRHRQARNKAALSGALLEVPGIGPKTAALLWANFDSLPDMAAATEETLAAIPGLGKRKARQLKSELSRFAKT